MVIYIGRPDIYNQSYFEIWCSLRIIFILKVRHLCGVEEDFKPLMCYKEVDFFCVRNMIILLIPSL